MFTRRERGFFMDPYFRVIREEEQFVELQSINTCHCWNIFKNQFEARERITLYHKHAQTDEYYHKHGQSCSVAEAIKQIKDHDEYVLEQKKLKEEIDSKVKMQPSRHLKVHETSGYKSRPTPTIVLKGAWLKEWGFASGDEVNVNSDGIGKLTITVKE